MYTSFIRPVLKCVSVVSDGCSSSISDLLENIQLCAARIVTSLPILASRDCLYLETGSEPLSSRRSIAKLDTMHKVYNSKLKFNSILKKQYLVKWITCPHTISVMDKTLHYQNTDLKFIKGHSYQMLYQSGTLLVFIKAGNFN